MLHNNLMFINIFFKTINIFPTYFTYLPYKNSKTNGFIKILTKMQKLDE